MDIGNLTELLKSLKTQGGGMVLTHNGKSEAVLLSIEKYYELIQGHLAPSAERISPKTVLVTGGAGYIGAHVVRELLATQHNVVVVDNLSAGKQEFLPDTITFYQGDLRDPSLLERVFTEHPIDVVMHLAASIEVGESVEKPLEYFRNNVLATQALLDAMVRHGIAQLVFSSTCAVYGQLERVPVPEGASKNPDSPYGYSKLIAEQIIDYYTRTTNLRATIFRYFNVCGTAPSSELYDTHGHSHVIPVIIDAIKKQAKFVINGKDYETFDGTCVRDYIHVVDVARAHVLAMEKPGQESLRIYNIGTGKGYSVEQIVTTATEVLNRMIPLEIGPRRPGDPPAAVADASKITRELGFKPEFSDLETILKTSK